MKIKTKTKVYNLISLFSGAMGLDIGLEKAGFTCVLSLDFDKSACATIKKNRPYLPLIEDDIRNYKPEDLLHITKLKKKEIFLIAGGPPCQAFSSAGKRMGLDDERGNVFLKFLEVVNYINPPYIIIENVRGILSTAVLNTPKTIYPISVPENLLKSKHGLIFLLSDQLDQMGYSISFTLYNTANYGVPQIRERVVILCNRGKLKIPLIPPLYFEHKSPKWRTLKDAIGDFKLKKMRGINFSENRLKYYRLLKAGQYWKNLPEELHKEAMGNSFYLGGGKTGFYRRLSWDKPSPTLVTSPAMPATDLCHPTELRPLSIEEYARIQQFPDDWEFVGKISDLYRQIGNAVPVGFAEIIGKHLLKFHRNKNRRQIGKIEKNNIKYSRYNNTDNTYFESILNSEKSQKRLF